MQTIVVGVDGSEHGEATLGFAADEAALRGGRLIIVCAWEFAMTITRLGSHEVESFQSLRGKAESIAEGIVQAAIARVGELQPSVICEGKAIEGQPADILLKETENADMIVVGSRGHGGFASLLLGSVGQQVAHHACCPVVIVR